MVTPATLPGLIPLARTAIALETLALRPGQSVEARVVGTSQTGATVLSVGKQLVNVNLPGSPRPGTSVQLQLQGSGAEARLVAAPRGQPQVVISGQGATASANAAPAGQGATNVNSVPTGQGTPTANATTAGQGATVRANTATVTPLPALQLASPQQAVAQAGQAAVLRQDSVGALFATLAGLGAKVTALPQPVAQAATQLLASRLRAGGDNVDARALKEAIGRSGVFFENLTLRSPAPAQLQGDMKALLLALRSALSGAQTGEGDAVPARPPATPPPTRGALPRAQPPLPQPPLNDLAPKEALRLLRTQVEGALSRLRLSQIASLPEAGDRAMVAKPSGEWTLELPLAWGDELGMAQFQISRDGSSKGRDADREWSMKFAINFSAIGEVGAHVFLRGGRVGALLWAERDETAALLQDHLDELTGALEGRGLEPGAIRVRHGIPEAPAAPAGHFLDDVS